MSFGGLILTNIGRNKMAAAISEKTPLQFTHIQLGDGNYNGSYSTYIFCYAVWNFIIFITINGL